MSEKSVNKKDDKDIVQQSIKMAYAGVVDEPVPSWMVSAITSPLRRGLINGALAVAVLSIGIGLGMMLKGLTTSDEPVVVAELNASDLGSQVHDLFTMDPVDPVQISADDPDFLNLWVSHRLKRKFELPDLSAHGLTALGARMVQDGNRAAVLNVFEDNDQNRFSLLARVNRSDGASSDARFSQSRKAQRLEWQHGQLVYALVGEGDEQQFKAIKTYISK